MCTCCTLLAAESPTRTLTFADLLNAWVYAIVVDGERDMALIHNRNDGLQFGCSTEEDGQVEETWWSCIFRSMPHLCVFESVEVTQVVNMATVWSEIEEGLL